MKAVGILLAGLTCGCLSAFGQGRFLFDTHDLAAGNDLRFQGFCFDGQVAPESMVEVLAGPDFTSASLILLTPALTVNVRASGPAYAIPSAQVFAVPGMTPGMLAEVVVRLTAGNQVSEY